MCPGHEDPPRSWPHSWPRSWPCSCRPCRPVAECGPRVRPASFGCPSRRRQQARPSPFCRFCLIFFCRLPSFSNAGKRKLESLGFMPATIILSEDTVSQDSPFENSVPKFDRAYGVSQPETCRAPKQRSKIGPLETSLGGSDHCRPGIDSEGIRASRQRSYASWVSRCAPPHGTGGATVAGPNRPTNRGGCHGTCSPERE